MKADSEGNAGPQSYNRTEADGAGNYIYIYIYIYTRLFCHTTYFILKTEDLPRQARDRHRKG